MGECEKVGGEDGDGLQNTIVGIIWEPHKFEIASIPLQIFEEHIPILTISGEQLKLYFIKLNGI